MAIGPLVLEKEIFEGFLLYMGVAATQTPQTNFFSPIPVRLCIKFGPAVLEKIIFENGGRWTGDNDERRWTDDGPWLY